MCGKFCKYLPPPTRVYIGIMMFLACFVNYMMRVNMSVIIIAMVPDRKAKMIDPDKIYTFSNRTEYRRDYLELNQPEGTVTFTWTATQQAHILGSYFWGYCITCLIGGSAAEYFGAKKVVAGTMMLTAIMTILCPAAAKIHYMALVLARFMAGFGGGFLFPALHVLVVHWAPPEEKGKFVAALIGGSIGTVVTWSLSGPVMETFGWDSGFYIPGAIAVIWCFCWMYLVYDTPVLHPRISKEEKEYILTSIGERVSHTKKLKPPLKKIFTSLPFLAMAVLQYGNNWGLYFIMTAAPKYVSACLKFNLTRTGTLSSLPYLVRMFASVAFGAIGDWIVKKKLMRTVVIRKFFSLFSHVIPGCFLLLLGYTEHPYISVAFITCSMGFNGAVTLTNLVNHQDLAPNFAGTLYGIANGVGNTAGFITPQVTAAFTRHGNGFAEWRPVFIVGATIYIATAGFFIIFGKADTQSWNYPNNEIPPQQQQK